MDKTLFAQRLRAAREAANISRIDFAVALGVSYTMASYYECGRNVPTIERLASMSSLLGCSADHLLGLSPGASESRPSQAG